MWSSLSSFLVDFGTCFWGCFNMVCSNYLGIACIIFVLFGVLFSSIYNFAGKGYQEVVFMWLLNLLKVIGIIFAMACCYLIATNPYTNPYKLIMIFGKKGSGKSTILTKYAIQYLKKGWTVYSTEHIPGVYYIPPGYIGKFMLKDYNYTPIDLDDYRGLKRLLLKLRLKFFPHRPKILLLIDEVGMIYDNRHFKNFNDSVRDFFKLQRHYYVKCVMFSQTFDVDKKLRDLTDCMYLVKNFARVFCYGKKIRKYQNINNDSADGSGGKIVDDYEFEHFLLF